MTPVNATATNDIRARLGTGWETVRAMIHRDGECAACGVTLGDQDVAVSLHESDSSLLTVAPTHASCRRADYRTGGTVSVPHPSYRITAAVLQAPAKDKRRSLSRRKRSTTPNADRPQQALPLVIINPSRDIHVGTCEDGVWRSVAQLNPQFDCLEPVPARPSVDGTATWGADLRSDGTVEVAAPSGARYLAPLNPTIAETLQAVGRALVILTDRVDVEELAAGVVGLHDVAAADDALCAVAALDALPATVPLPNATGFTPRPGSEVLNTTGKVSAALLDTECSIRAVLGNDDCVQLAPLPFPMLLIEPIRAIRVPGDVGTGEVKLDVALSYGMRLIDSAGPPALRDFTVTRTGKTITLRASDGEEIGVGVLDAVPQRWLDALDGFGGENIAVVYGPVIGVRPEQPGQHFPEHDRFAELNSSREQGIVAWTVARYIDKP